MAEPNPELSQAMLQRVLDTQAHHTSLFTDMKHRFTAVERHIAAVRRDMVLDAETTVNLQDRARCLSSIKPILRRCD